MFIFFQLSTLVQHQIVYVSAILQILLVILKICLIWHSFRSATSSDTWSFVFLWMHDQIGYDTRIWSAFIHRMGDCCFMQQSVRTTTASNTVYDLIDKSPSDHSERYHSDNVTRTIYCSNWISSKWNAVRELRGLEAIRAKEELRL